MTSHSIQPIGFRDTEHAWFEALLTLGGAMLNEAWRWTLEGPADAYLASVASAEEWNALVAGLPQRAIIAFCHPDITIETHWRIKRQDDKLPSLREIIATLNKVGAELAATGPAETSGGYGLRDMVAEAPSAAPAAVEEKPALPLAVDQARGGADATQYDPGQHLIGIARDARADGRNRRVRSANGGGTVLIDPGRGLYFMPHDRVEPWAVFGATRDQCAVACLEAPALEREAHAMKAAGRPLGELVFLAALLGSKGRLWRGCSPDETVRLLEWPDFKDLPNARDYVNLTAFMCGNTADLATIAAHTRLPPDLVIGFHNACMAEGLLERGGPPTVREKPVNAGLRDLYRKIAKRLHIGHET